MKAMVIIPTTTRPVVITSLRERRALPASLIVAEGDFRALPISADYDKLIGVAGPLGTLTGQGGLPSHELRLSHAFESGRSWEVPVCLAHYLVSRGASLVKDIGEADIVVWATGAVDLDLGIVKDRYYLGQKLAATLPMVGGRRQGTSFELFMPAGVLDGDGEPEQHQRLADQGVNVVEVRTVRDAVERLDVLVDERMGEDRPARASSASVPYPVKPEVETGRRRVRGWRLVASLIALAMLAGGGWLAATGWLTVPRTSLARAPAPKPDVSPQQAITTKNADSGSTAKAEPPPVTKNGKGAGGATDNGTPAQPKVLNPQPEPSPPPHKESKGVEQAKGEGTGDGNGEVKGPANDEAKSSTQAAVEPPRPPPERKAAAEDLLVIEEQRAPQGSTCKQLHFSGARPEISLLRAKDGRFPASDVNGLCALVYRRLPTGTSHGIELAEPLMRATMDKAVFGRERAGLKAGDVGRVLRDDIRASMTYQIVLKPSPGLPGSGERRYAHELRR